MKQSSCIYVKQFVSINESLWADNMSDKKLDCNKPCAYSVRYTADGLTAMHVFYLIAV